MRASVSEVVGNVLFLSAWKSGVGWLRRLLRRFHRVRSTHFFGNLARARGGTTGRATVGRSCAQRCPRRRAGGQDAAHPGPGERGQAPQRRRALGALRGAAGGGAGARRAALGGTLSSRAAAGPDRVPYASGDQRASSDPWRSEQQEWGLACRQRAGQACAARGAAAARQTRGAGAERGGPRRRR